MTGRVRCFEIGNGRVGKAQRAHHLTACSLMDGGHVASLLCPLRRWPHRKICSAACCSSMMVFASTMRPSEIIASAGSIGSSSTSMSSPSSARPPPLPMRIAGFVFGDEEVQLLGDGAGAHEGLEHLAHVVQSIADFLFRLRAYALLGRLVVEHAGGRPRSADRHGRRDRPAGGTAASAPRYGLRDCTAAAPRHGRGRRPRASGSAIRRRRGDSRTRPRSTGSAGRRGHGCS